MKKKENGYSLDGPAVNTLRHKLIDNIMFYSGDEYESKQDLLDLAKESDEQLIDRLINILSYYHERSEENL